MTSFLGDGTLGPVHSVMVVIVYGDERGKPR